MDPTPDPPADDAPDGAQPPLSAMDRVQDRDDYLATRYERDYNRRYVEAYGDHSGFRGSEETDAEFAAKNPDGADPDAHRSTSERLAGDAPEPLPGAAETSSGSPTLGRLFLAPDDDDAPDDAR